MAADVRAIANSILDMVEISGHKCTNMALNKLVYFAYEDFLLQSNKQLTHAKIEAWEHGPVFREVYHCFKKFGEKPIGERATKVSPVTGLVEVCKLDDLGLELFLKESLTNRIIQSASKLRNLSHLPGSPWDVVWNHSGKTNAGMEITDEIIIGCFNKGWRQ